MNFRNWHKLAEMVALKTCPACNYQDLASLVNQSGFCRFCLEQRARAAQLSALTNQQLASVQQRKFQFREATK